MPDETPPPPPPSFDRKVVAALLAADLAAGVAVWIVDDGKGGIRVGPLVEADAATGATVARPNMGA